MDDVLIVGNRNAALYQKCLLAFECSSSHELGLNYKQKITIS